MIFVFCWNLRADYEARVVPNPIDLVAGRLFGQAIFASQQFVVQ
jgi:hypothetical protein